MTEQNLINNAPSYLTDGFNDLIHEWVFIGEGEEKQLSGYHAKEVISQKPKIALTDVVVNAVGAVKQGAIWWIPRNTVFTLTANAALPNSQMMLMIEQVVRDESGVYQTINDMRVIADIANQIVTIKGRFEKSGNYRIKAERLNMGLDEIGAPFNLSFDLIEFDAYEQTA